LISSLPTTKYHKVLNHLARAHALNQTPCVLITMLLAALVALLLLLLLLYFGDCDLRLRCVRLFLDWATTKSFRGKTVWITGASSGIGEACAVEFARRGARLVLSARRKDQLRAVRQKCADPEKHVVIGLDLQDVASHEAIVKEVLAVVGEVDLLLNNAGRSQRSLVEATTLDVFESQLRLNTLGTISLTKALYPHLKPGTSVMAVTSIAGKLGSPGAAAYSVSKFALHGFFEAFRIEAAERGVSVGLVCPGPVVSEGGANAMTGTGGVASQDPDTPPSAYDKRRMGTGRCATLVACAARFALLESWISPQPELIITYLSQYVPFFYQWLSLQLGPARLKSFKRKLE